MEWIRFATAHNLNHRRKHFVPEMIGTRGRETRPNQNGTSPRESSPADLILNFVGTKFPNNLFSLLWLFSLHWLFSLLWLFYLLWLFSLLWLFLAALAALYLTLVTEWVTDRHFRLSTQRVTFQTSDNDNDNKDNNNKNNDNKGNDKEGNDKEDNDNEDNNNKPNKTKTMTVKTMTTKTTTTKTTTTKTTTTETTTMNTTTTKTTTRQRPKIFKV